MRDIFGNCFMAHVSLENEWWGGREKEREKWGATEDLPRRDILLKWFVDALRGIE